MYAKTSSKTPLDLSKSQNAFESFTNCWYSNRLSILKNGKIYGCPMTATIEHFNMFYNKNLEVSHLDCIDIYNVTSYNDILLFLSKPIPFCEYCDVKNWRTIGPWRSSKKDISEYTEE